MKQKIRFRMRFPASVLGESYIAPEGYLSYFGFELWLKKTGMVDWPLAGRRVSQ